MKDLKNALIASACIVFLSVAGFAIWAVKQYLPIVGIVLLVVLVLGAILALALGVEFVARRFTRYEHHQIAQYGSVLHRHRSIEVIAPFHPPSRAIAPPVYETDIEEVEEEEVYQELPAPVPTFAQLLKEGVIQAAISQGQILLGFTAAGEPRFGSWLDLYSCLIGGVSGSGKSTTVRFLLFQAALAGARMIFVDPHIGDEEESLAAQFRALPGIHQLPPCDDNAAAVLKRVQWLTRELARRKKTGMKTPFLVFVVDELNALFLMPEVKKELSELLMKIGREGRKFGLFFMGIGQRFSQQDLGGAPYGAAVREAMASELAHRFTSEDQAKKFIGSRNGPRCLELSTGRWLFRDTQGQLTEMETPDTRAEDGAAITRLLLGTRNTSSTEPRGYAPESRTESSLKTPDITGFLPETTGGKVIPLGTRFSPETSPETSETSDETSPESGELLSLARQIMSLQAAGAQKAEIMRQVWGVSPGGSQEYRTAQEQYQAVMQFIASQIGA